MSTSEYLSTLPLHEALWWFIENVSDETPHRSDMFFALRERVRDRAWPERIASRVDVPDRLADAVRHLLNGAGGDRPAFLDAAAAAHIAQREALGLRACRYVVNGAVHPDDPDGPEFQSDGEHPPFVVFDVDRQDHLPGRYATRAEAEAALVVLVVQEAVGTLVFAELSTAKRQAATPDPDLEAEHEGMTP